MLPVPLAIENYPAGTTARAQISNISPTDRIVTSKLLMATARSARRLTRPATTPSIKQVRVITNKRTQTLGRSTVLIKVTASSLTVEPCTLPSNIRRPLLSRKHCVALKSSGLSSASVSSGLGVMLRISTTSAECCIKITDQLPSRGCLRFKEPYHQNLRGGNDSFLAQHPASQPVFTGISKADADFFHQCLS